MRSIVASVALMFAAVSGEAAYSQSKLPDAQFTRELFVRSSIVNVGTISSPALACRNEKAVIGMAENPQQTTPWFNILEREGLCKRLRPGTQVWESASVISDQWSNNVCVRLSKEYPGPCYWTPKAAVAFAPPSPEKIAEFDAVVLTPLQKLMTIRAENCAILGEPLDPNGCWLRDDNGPVVETWQRISARTPQVLEPPKP